MDKEQALKLVKEYAKIVTQNLIVNKIVLYGSYARGDYRKSSDIDVAVIVPKASTSKNILKDMAKLCELSAKISYDIEPVLLIDEEDRSGFLDEVLSYGEVIYSK